MTSIHVEKLIELLAELSENKNLRATGKECLKGGLLTGLSAVLGGLLLGPVGFAVGGALGGIGSAVAVNDFKPVAVILKEMTPLQKNKLANILKQAFRDFGIKDLTTLCMLLAANTSFQEVAFTELSKFLTNEMNMRIRNI